MRSLYTTLKYLAIALWTAFVVGPFSVGAEHVVQGLLFGYVRCKVHPLASV